MGIFSQKGFSFDKNRTHMHGFLISGWLFYFFLHSFLASLKVKKYFSESFPGLNPYYRIAYNVIAIVGLGILLTFTLPLASLSVDTFIGGIITGIRFLRLWIFSIMGLASVVRMEKLLMSSPVDLSTQLE